MKTIIAFGIIIICTLVILHAKEEISKKTELSGNISIEQQDEMTGDYLLSWSSLFNTTPTLDIFNGYQNKYKTIYFINPEQTEIQFKWAYMPFEKENIEPYLFYVERKKNRYLIKIKGKKDITILFNKEQK